MPSIIKARMFAIPVVVIAAIGTAGTLHAATIPATPPGSQISGTGAGGTGIGFVFATTAPGNDNSILGSPNLISLNWAFTAIGPIDFVFTPDNAGDTGPSNTTEYLFNNVEVHNMTGLTWTGFQFQLGSTDDTGVFHPGSTLVDFDTPGNDPSPTSSIGFSSFSHLDKTLAFLGGSVVPSSTVFVSFSIDVPDSLDSPFTLRATPAATPAPEPASLLMLGLGLAGGGAWRRYLRGALD